MSWVYIQTEPQLWTTGHYDPSGKWHSDSDYDSQDEAAARCHWLNGGEEERVEVVLDRSDMRQILERLAIANADDGK